MKHVLKTHPEPFEALRSGVKTAMSRRKGQTLRDDDGDDFLVTAIRSERGQLLDEAP